MLISKVLKCVNDAFKKHRSLQIDGSYFTLKTPESDNREKRYLNDLNTTNREDYSFSNPVENSK